jgi:hypothetical protein
MTAPSHKVVLRTLVSVALALALLGCGGPDGPARYDEGAVQLYFTERFRQDNRLSLMQFDGGLTYGIYQSDYFAPTPPEFAFAGFFVAQAEASPDGLQRRGHDFDFEAGAARPVTLDNFSADDALLKATLRSTSTGESFVAVRAGADQLPSDTSLLPGRYAVQARSPDGGRKAAATVDASGTVMADLGKECRFEGRLQRRPLGPVYDATGQLSVGCPIGSGAFGGHAFQNPNTLNIYIMLTRPSANGVMLLLVQDQS